MPAIVGYRASCCVGAWRALPGRPITARASPTCSPSSAKRAGIIADFWADASEAPIAAAEAGRRAGSFALVTGTVAGAVSNAAGTVLYFGADQHNGFVLSFVPDVVKLCRDAGLDPASLTGKTVLTRGYVDGTRRPTIAIAFPEQIEVLKKAAGRQKKAAPKSLSGPR